ncbi:heterokaryon incompatibility protein-domain-containing protein [Ilyonectria robusta]|uniref:heterokaryon incompatibility protein-domain-containing protein n=1 Tax=Ilyonectria robusta TaxID=1079257 RepID=UPI001E8DBC5A|nr:heterokaryon incompatibility protein-domain-containing protein [Ilyonectria robusta]KAH8675142.1 heterokaryon incompatibility protein-domain-containing protein [Ilyonectria robusta]
MPRSPDGPSRWLSDGRAGDALHAATSERRAFDGSSSTYLTSSRSSANPTSSSLTRSSSSSSLSSAGGCLLEPAEVDDDVCSSSSIPYSSPSPLPPHQHLSSEIVYMAPPRPKNPLSFLYRPRITWDYSFQPALSYLQRIDRSPSPEIKQLGDTKYQYRQLDAQRREIRLLRILPQKTSWMECELSHVSLSAPPEYVAISYAWGDLEDTRSIMLDGHDFPITLSLWQILNRLRSDDAVIIVWADAVCINQKDSTERSHQVQRMTEIYAEATSVVAWLGPDYDNSHLAIDLILELVKADTKDTSHCRGIIMSHKWKDHFVALGEFMERDYWYRLWIVQEIFNARHVDMYCGSVKLPLSTLTAASEILARHRETVEWIFGSDQITKRKEQLRCSLLMMRPRESRYDENRKYGLRDAIQATSEHLCNDPRDKVYGILGLLSDNERSQILPDYNLSTRRVYTNAVEHIIKTTKSLQVICRPVFACCMSAHQDKGLPTWLPDFSDSRLMQSIIVWDHFKASKDTDASVSFIDRQRKLKTLMIHIDYISSRGISLPPIFSLTTVVMTFLQWCSMVIEKYDFQESAHLAFCRLFRTKQSRANLLTDRQWMKRVYGTIKYYQHSWLRGLAIDRRLDVLAGERPFFERDDDADPWILDELGRGMVSRRFCISDSGLFALVSGSAHEDDEIYVPLGAPLPIVLRRDGLEYKYVGEAYVDGYMFGKAIDELERGEREVQSVILV